MIKLSCYDMMRIEAIVKLAGDDEALLARTIDKVAAELAEEYGMDKEAVVKPLMNMAKGVGKRFMNWANMAPKPKRLPSPHDAAAKAAIVRTYGQPALRKPSGVVAR